jgi:hypothetical protein
MKMIKKITTFAILTAAAFPALATEAPTVAENLDAAPALTEPAAAPAEDAAPVVAESVVEEKSNSKIKFPRGVQAGLGVSVTSGVNGFVGYANKDFESFWWKRLGVRLDFATTAPVKSAINSAIDAALDRGVEIGDGMTVGGGSFKAHHIGALVDIYPFGNTWFLGGLRLTGGYVLGQANLAAKLAGEFKNVPGGAFEFELEGIKYQYLGNSAQGTADVDWKYSGPYLGTGFDLGLFWGIKIFMDAGVVFTSKTASAGLDIPMNNLQVWDNGAWTNVVAGPLENQLNMAKAAALADANDELEDIKFYPMVKLGFMYRF